MADGLTARRFSIQRIPGFTTTAVACFLMLYAPIITLVIFSFNDGRFIAINHKHDWDVIRKIDAANGVSYDCK